MTTAYDYSFPSPKEIARILGGDVTGARQVMAPGPGHSPADRSLSVRVDPNSPEGFVVHSFSGDDAIACRDYVRSKIGLPEWTPEKPKLKTVNKIAAQYDYRDEDGDLLFQVVRLEPKDFRQRRPMGGGEWAWGIKGVRRVLYRLQALIGAVNTNRTIYIAEGEKSVDALVKEGLAATCSPMGAEKWREEYSTFLRGANVVILPDNDKPGEDHARAVAAALTGIAKSVRVLRLAGLPESGDVYDWLQAGGDAEQLCQATELADEWKPEAKPEPTDWRSHAFTAAQLRNMVFAPVSYVVPGIIPEGLTILAGRPKIGKSWMALDLALGIANGEAVLGGVDAEQGDVLYCCLEDNPRRLRRRVTKLVHAGAWPDRLTLATQWRRLDKGGVADIEDWANSVPNPRLVLLDTLAGVRPTRSGNDTLYEGDYAALRDVHRFANDRGMGVVALHHTRKMEADDPVDTISGSLGLAGCADTCLILARSSSGTTLYVRGRDIEEGEKAVMFGTENCRWSLLGEAAEVHRTDNQKKILAALEAATGLMNPADIAAVTELSSAQLVTTTLHRLAERGEAVQVSRGRWAYPGKPFATPKAEKS
jgi:hypothetical protein